MTAEVTPSNIPANGGEMPLATMTPETVAAVQGLIEAFNRSAEGLQQAYQDLQRKVDSLNLRLEETNRELTASLAEQERLSSYLTNILESLSSGVIVVDTDGVITRFNPGAEAITGIPAAQAVGCHYRAIMGEDARDEDTLLGVLATGNAINDREKQLMARGGRITPVGYSASPLLHASGEIIGAVELIMDLSPIKALESELARMDKLAALGRMSAVMAHKIRNPLGGIVGYAGLLELSLPADDRLRRQTRKIIEGVEKIDRIITNVLEYNAPLNLTCRTIDLGVCVDETVEAFRRELEPSFRDRIEFTVHRSAEAVPVTADPDRLGQAMRELLTNAVEAIEGSGAVTVDVVTAQPDAIIGGESGRPGISSHDGSSRTWPGIIACVRIGDTGEGIDDESRQQLYVPFFTTRENGIGLGLATVRKIMEAHGGEVLVESIPGRGTLGTLVLPLASCAIRQ